MGTMNPNVGVPKLGIGGDPLSATELAISPRTTPHRHLPRQPPKQIRRAQATTS